MRKLLVLAGLIGLLVPGEALACTNTVDSKDAGGVTRTFCRGTDGTASYVSWYQLVDGSGNVASQTANALDVNIKSGGTLTQGAGIGSLGGSLVFGRVNTVAPTGYADATVNSLSLDLSGNLRTSLTTALPAGTAVIGHVINDASSAVIGHVIVDTTSTTAVTQATASNLNAAVVGTGAAGSAAGGVLTVQGAAGMTKVLVTPDLPAGAATAANQTSSLGSIAPGTAPTSMQIGGAVYNVTAPTPADTQTLALQADVEGRLKVASQPALTNMVTGTASTTTTTTTSLVALVATKRLYITSFSCDNTGSSTSQILFQDGSGGATIWSTLVPAGGASNQGTGTPMFRTTSGNALFFAAQTASTTIRCSAAGFSGA